MVALAAGVMGNGRTVAGLLANRRRTEGVASNLRAGCTCLATRPPVTQEHLHRVGDIFCRHSSTEL